MSFEERVIFTVREIDNFEFAIYGIRRFLEELEEEEAYLLDSALSISTIQKILEESLVEMERILKNSIKEMLLFHFSARRIVLSDMEKFKIYRVLEKVEARNTKEAMEALFLYLTGSEILERLKEEYSRYLGELDELKSEKEYIKLMSISALTERVEILRILRSEEKVRAAYRRKIEEKLEEIPEELRGKSFSRFEYPLRNMELYGIRDVEGGWFIEAGKGTPVVAVKGGKVVYSGWLTGYGNTVIIQHEGYYSVYAHLEEVDVSKGEVLFPGDKIGEVGDTGSIYGIGLYFEIRYGKKKMDLKEIYKNVKGGSK